MIGLELLRYNHAGILKLKNGRTINYGIIRRDDEKIIHFNDKGLAEWWKIYRLPDQNEKMKKLEEFKMMNEDELARSGFVETTFLKDIERILF